MFLPLLSTKTDHYTDSNSLWKPTIFSPFYHSFAYWQWSKFTGYILQVISGMTAEKEKSCRLQPSTTPKSKNYVMIHPTHQNMTWTSRRTQFGTMRSQVEHSGAGNSLRVDGGAGNSPKLNTVGQGMVSGWTVGQGTVSSWTQWGRELSQVEHSGAGNSLKLNTVGQGTVSSWTQWGREQSQVEHSGAGNSLGVDSGAGNGLKLNTVGQGMVSSWTQ